jgi:hypothetical protein
MFREEQAWIAANRQNYAGKWVALRGRELIAVGDRAGEVFSKVRSIHPPPCVIQVGEDDLPFAGW